MSDLYSHTLYEKPLEQAIAAQDLRLLSKIVKIVDTFPQHKTIDFFGGALCLAAEHGFLKGVRKLMTVSDPTYNNSAALRWAAMHGHEACVKTLIPVSDPKAENSHALTLAVGHGQVGCVKALIKVSDPKECGSVALKIAAEGGHLECVKLLIPVSDATDNRSEALCRALKNGFWDVAEVLYPHSDLDGALESLTEWDGSDEKTQWLENKIVERAQILHDRIAQKVQHRGVTARKSKM